ncbi:MAG: DUF1559 domain-containing protein, partial [Gemmataceae bacterium]
MIRRRGFSLVELLVVVGVMSILIGLLMPAVQNVRQAAARAVCGNRLKEIGLALHQHHDAAGRFPPGYQFLIRDEPYMFQNWPARLLPYLEQSALWDTTVAAYRTTPGDPFANPPHVGYGTVVKAFLCPADGRVSSPRAGHLTPRERGYSSYLGVNGRDQTTRNGVLFVDSRVRLVDVTDGTSQT